MSRAFSIWGQISSTPAALPLRSFSTTSGTSARDMGEVSPEVKYHTHSQMFLVHTHFTFGFTRSVRLSLPPSDPIHHQVVICGSSLHMSVQDIGPQMCTTNSIIDLWPRVLCYQLHLCITLCLNMVFVSANPLLAQESNNKAPLTFK